MRPPTNSCPICQSRLLSHSEGRMDFWMCEQNHGVALTLSEAYETAQEDEMRLLWLLATGKRPDVGHPRPSTRGCPGCAAKMVTVDLPYDDDEVDEGEEGDGENLGSIEVEVCTICQFVWFDAGSSKSCPPTCRPGTDRGTAGGAGAHHRRLTANRWRRPLPIVTPRTWPDVSPGAWRTVPACIGRCPGRPSGRIATTWPPHATDSGPTRR
ncbi:MAG: hypothetical protein R2704_13980 [Microthrixaceae bacterium]